MHPRLRKYLLVSLLLLSGIPLFAVKKTRILILLDASSSMTQPWSDHYSKYDVACNILLNIIDSVYAVNNEVEFAVRAYGSLHPAQEKNCTDTRLEVPFNFQNVNQIKTRLKYLTPVGFSPIAYSLEQAAANELALTKIYDYSIIFITDGGESCGGDICATFSKFIQSKITVQPYVIGLDRNEKLRSYYNCMGKYVDVLSGEDIPRAVSMIVDANRSILDKPKSLNLTTTTSNVEQIKDTVKPIVAPISIPKDELVSLLWTKTSSTKLDHLYVFKLRKNPFNKPATLRFNFEEIKPINDIKPILASMFVRKYFVRTNADPIIKGKLRTYKNNKPATLRFDWEEPLIRQTDVYPWITMSGLKKLPKAPLMVKGNVVPIKKGKATIRIDYEEPLVRNTDALNAKMNATWKKIPEKKALLISGKLSKWRSQATATLRFDFEVLKKEKMDKLTWNAYPKRTGYAMALPNRKYDMDKSRATLRFTLDAPAKPVVKKDTAKIKPAKTDDDMKFVVKSETSTETQIQIFLIGEDGKEYPKAQPKIQILDPITKDTLYTFIRTLENGIPKIEKINPGTYDVIIKEYNVASSFNVKILPNNINKVELKLRNGTLHFAYSNNFSKPMKYNAVVVKRFAEKLTVVQKCTDVLSYNPGQYYIEINTLPVTKRSMFIDFFVPCYLTILEPGTVQFTNTNALGKVTLQCTLGDGFANFYDLNITGKINDQTLELMPGLYKAIFATDPKSPMAGTTTVVFKVETGKNTLVELK